MSRVKVIGVPYEVGARGETAQAKDSHDAPDAIRNAYRRVLSGFNIPKHFDDLGDVTCDESVDGVLKAVEDKVYEMVSQGHIPAVLGGAHTLTLGSLRALHRARKDYSLVYFDTHPDLMPRDVIDYGSSMYHAIKEGAVDPQRIFFIGIRQIEDEEWDIIHKYDIAHVTPTEFATASIDSIYTRVRDRLEPPYYLSIDLDCLDPNFAPGVTTPYPFGILPRELLVLASRFCRDELLGLEIVELSPSRDIGGLTTTMAATLLHSLSEVIEKS